MDELILEPQNPSDSKLTGMIIGLYMFLIMPLIVYFSHRNPPLAIYLVWFIFCSLVVLILKRPLKLTFSPLTATLTYDYLNGYGIHKTQSVDFNKPLHYEYKYTAEGRRIARWRLQVFNNYLIRRIEVNAVASDKFFTKEQLDELNAIIMKYKNS